MIARGRAYGAIQPRDPCVNRRHIGAHDRELDHIAGLSVIARFFDPMRDE
jgi:hypothetical protein